MTHNRCISDSHVRMNHALMRCAALQGEGQGRLKEAKQENTHFCRVWLVRKERDEEESGTKLGHG